MRSQSTAESSLATADVQTRVRVDNTTSHDYTILDVFARNGPRLLYGVARALFEQLGARAWSERLDEALAREPVTA